MACINSPVGKPHLICFTNGQGEVAAVDSATLSVAFTITIPNVELQVVTINDNSDAAGWRFDNANPASPSSFFYRGGVVTKFPDFSVISKLNNSGQGCGAVGPGSLPAIFDTTGPIPVVSKLLPLLPGCDTGFALGLNDAGWVVGNCYGSDNIERPFVYNGAETIDLNTVISPPSWTVIDVRAINNSGQIVGVGWRLDGNGNEVESALILTPGAPAPLNVPNINALLWAMLFGGVANDEGGPILVGGRIPDWVGPLGPSILSPAAQDAVVGLAVDAVARRLGDQVGAEAIRSAALQMTARAVNCLMAPTLSPASRSASAPRPAAGPARRRGRFPFPLRPRGEPPKS